MWFTRFKQDFSLLVMPWLFAVIFPFLGRLILLFSYVDAENRLHYQHDVWQLLVTGLRFDIRIATLTFGSLLLLSFFTLFSTKFTRQWQKLLTLINPILLMVIALFTLINIFYYITYDRYIDVFIFGLLDDDTTAILKTIWSDYPVIWAVLGLTLLGYILAKLCRSWQYWVIKSITKTTPNWLALPACLVAVALIVIGCRGSIGTFPLRESDAQISSYAVLNKFVPNGVIAFDWAYKAYKNNNKFMDIPLKESQQALATFFQQTQPNDVTIFMQQTAANPVADAHPPHVVFAVMESMGSHLFRFDNPQRDLYGSLRQHWQQDWVFNRFVSEGDGTIDSLNRFFVRSPIDKISQSSAQNADFISNMFKPFKAKGYKIVYITAGNGAWRNLNRFLPHLGVDEFVEQNTLKEAFPDATISTWGVPDEYMFKYAEQRLAQAEKQGEPIMIMMMSITNHPPYQLPPNHPYHPYSFTPQELTRLKNMGNEDEIRTMFNTFSYSNDQLGRFISWVKAQPLGSHTLIAATGDHNIRGIGYPDPAELMLSHAVPFYLYVPTTYQYQTLYDKTRIGSHKDIMPTLYQLALSSTPYYQTGCNLVALKLDSPWCNVGYNPYVTINQQGAYALINNTFQPWQDDTGLLVKPVTTMNEEQQQTLARWQSWSLLLHWQLNQQISTDKKH